MLYIFSVELSQIQWISKRTDSTKKIKRGGYCGTYQWCRDTRHQWPRYGIGEYVICSACSIFVWFFNHGTEELFILHFKVVLCVNVFAQHGTYIALGYELSRRTNVSFFRRHWIISPTPKLLFDRWASMHMHAQDHIKIRLLGNIMCSKTVVWWMRLCARACTGPHV